MDPNIFKMLPKGMRKGSATTNRFLNFWTQYCHSYYNLNMTECTEKALEMWKSLSNSEKANYSAKLLKTDFDWIDNEAISSDPTNIPPKKRAPRKTEPSKSKAPKVYKLQNGSACTLKRKKLINQYKLSNYLNFLRYFKAQHNDLEAEELIRNAADAWSCMSEKEKYAYRRKPKTNIQSNNQL